MHNNYSRSLLNAALRNDFGAFIERCFCEVTGGETYEHNWHIDAIAFALQKCANRETKRQIITLPPRSLKSLIASVALPAWILGHNPSAKIIAVSYSNVLSGNLARQCRSILHSAWYKRVFPHTRISSKKDSEEQFETTQHGGRFATSVGGSLTGIGGDFIIIDDPLKAEDAESESARRNLHHWYENTLYSRLNDKREGVIIIVGQRLHDDDLVGHVFEKEPWTKLNLPAIAVINEKIETSRGRYYHRAIGDLLHPAREPRQVLDQLKGSMGSRVFEAQYQQSPVPPEGALVKLEWFQHYDEVPRKSLICQSWDTASKSGELNDYSVCTTWAIHRNKYYLIDVFRKRMDYPELKRRAIELALKYRAHNILIEDAATGVALSSELEVISGLGCPELCTPHGDKIMRMSSESASIEEGRVLLPKEAPWLTDFLYEVRAFPHGKHDDQIDSMSQAIHWWEEYQRNRVYVYRQ